MPNKPKRRQSTKLQRQLAALLVSEPHIELVEALKRLGYSNAVALHHGKRTVQAPGTQQEIHRLLEHAGITHAKVFGRLNEALDYNTTKFHMGIPVATLIDNRNRLSAVELAMKAMGILKETDQRQIIVLAFKTVVDELTPVLAPCIHPDKKAVLAASLSALGQRLGGSPDRLNGVVQSIVEVKQDAATGIVEKKNGSNGHQTPSDVGF